MKDFLKTHPLDVGRLVVGLAFLGAVAVWLVIQVSGVDLRNAQWLLPATLIAAGTVGLVASGARGVTRSRRRGHDEAGTAYDGPTDVFPVYDPTADLTEELTRAELAQREHKARQTEKQPLGEDHHDDNDDTNDEGAAR